MPPSKLTRLFAFSQPLLYPLIFSVLTNGGKLFLSRWLSSSPLLRYICPSVPSTAYDAHTAQDGRSGSPNNMKPSRFLTCWDGPPTPRTGPANPAGAWGMGTPAGTPLPAARPTPGPPAAPASGTRAMPV